MTNPTSNLQRLLMAQQMQNQNSQENNQVASPLSASEHVHSQPVSSHIAMARLLSSMKESETGIDAGFVQTELGYEHRDGTGTKAEARPGAAARALSQDSNIVCGPSVVSNHNTDASFNAHAHPINNMSSLSPLVSHFGHSDNKTPGRSSKPPSALSYEVSRRRPTSVSRKEAIPKQHRGYRSTSGSEVCLFDEKPLPPRATATASPARKVSKSLWGHSSAQPQRDRNVRQQSEVLDLGSDEDEEKRGKDAHLVSSDELPGSRDVPRGRPGDTRKVTPFPSNRYPSHKETNLTQQNNPALDGSRLVDTREMIGSGSRRPNAAATEKMPVDRMVLKKAKRQEDLADVLIPDVKLFQSVRDFTSAQYHSMTPTTIVPTAYLDKQKAAEEETSYYSRNVKRKNVDGDNQPIQALAENAAELQSEGLNKALVSKSGDSTIKAYPMTSVNTEMKKLEHTNASNRSSIVKNTILQHKPEHSSTNLDRTNRDTFPQKQKQPLRRQTTCLERMERKESNDPSPLNDVFEKPRNLAISKDSQISLVTTEREVAFAPCDDGRSLFVQNDSDEDEHEGVRAGNDDRDTVGDDATVEVNVKINESAATAPSDQEMSFGEAKRTLGVGSDTKRVKNLEDSLRETFASNKLEEARQQQQQQQQQQQIGIRVPNSKTENPQSPKAALTKNHKITTKKRSKKNNYHAIPEDRKRMQQLRKILKGKRRVPTVFRGPEDCTANEMLIGTTTARGTKVDDKVNGARAEKMVKPMDLSVKGECTVKYADGSDDIVRHSRISPSGNTQSQTNVNSIASKKAVERVKATTDAECNQISWRSPGIPPSHETGENDDPRLLLKLVKEKSERAESSEAIVEKLSRAECEANEFSGTGEGLHDSHSTLLGSATAAKEQSSTQASDCTHNNSTGHNPAHDKLIYELRGKDRKWKEVQQSFETRTGRHLSLKVLRTRCKVAAHRLEVEFYKKKTEKQKEVDHQSKPHTVVEENSKNNPIADKDCVRGASESSNEDINIHSSGDFAKTGSKSWNSQVFQAYLVAMADRVEYDERETVEAFSAVPSSHVQEPHRFDSPVTNEDVCHWVYQIKRKTWITSESDGTDDDEDDNITDPEAFADWYVVGATSYSSLQQANYAAGQEVFRERDCCALGPDIRHWSYQLNENDMAEYFGIMHDNIRHFRVIVDRFLRNPAQAALPSSKVGWLSKRVYEVKQRVTQVKVDGSMSDNFDKVDEEHGSLHTAADHVEERVLDGLYTILDQANREAGHRVLEMTTKPNSIRIDDQLNRAEAQKEMREELDKLEASNSIFSQTFNLSDGREATIWVEQRELKGPRNI